MWPFKKNKQKENKMSTDKQGRHYWVRSQQSFEYGKTDVYLLGLMGNASKLQRPEYYSLNDLARQYGLDAITYMRAYLDQERDNYLKSDKCKMVTAYLQDQGE